MYNLNSRNNYKMFEGKINSFQTQTSLVIEYIRQIEIWNILYSYFKRSLEFFLVCHYHPSLTYNPSVPLSTIKKIN